MSGTTLKFKNLNSLSSSFKRYVLTTFSPFFLQEISLIRDFGPPYRRLSEDVRAQVLSWSNWPWSHFLFQPYKIIIKFIFLSQSKRTLRVVNPSYTLVDWRDHQEAQVSATFWGGEKTAQEKVNWKFGVISLNVNGFQTINKGTLLNIQYRFFYTWKIFQTIWNILDTRKNRMMYRT